MSGPSADEYAKPDGGVMFGTPLQPHIASTYPADVKGGNALHSFGRSAFLTTIALAHRTSTGWGRLAPPAAARLAKSTATRVTDRAIRLESATTT